MLKKSLESVGRYLLFLKQVFRKPEKWRIFFGQFINEADKLIISSILLVGVISLFIGGVLVISACPTVRPTPHPCFMANFSHSSPLIYTSWPPGRNATAFMPCSQGACSLAVSHSYWDKCHSSAHIFPPFKGMDATGHAPLPANLTLAGVD